MDRLKIALLELDGTHEECLYSQLLFLERDGNTVEMIYDVSMQRKMIPFDTGDRERIYSIKDKTGIAYWKTLWEIRNYVVKNGFDVAIFNSTHGDLLRNFTLLPFPKKIRFFGTLHGINKLEGSFTQNIISRRVKHYFLLNDYLVDNLKYVKHSGLQLDSFYPIDFPDFKGQPVINKPKGECWIGVPGQVEFKRRDYLGLVNAFAAVKDKPGFKFMLLGSYEHRGSNGAEMKALIQKLGLDDYFVFTGYLQYPEYHAYIKQCDVIMPLVHPGNDSYIKYLKYQITGGYNLAFAYKKPLAMLEDFNVYEDFKENAVFYSLENLPAMLATLPTAIKAILPQTYKQRKWAFDYRADKYMHFIRSGKPLAQ